jgi:hypothetical protein
MFVPMLAFFGIDDAIIAAILISTAASAGASAIVSDIAQKKAKAAAEKAREQQLKGGLQLAGQELAMTKEEMTMQVGQRKIQGLTEVLMATRPAPNIVTLPSAAPEPTWIDKINQQIHSLVSGG